MSWIVRPVHNAQMFKHSKQHVTKTSKYWDSSHFDEKFTLCSICSSQVDRRLNIYPCGTFECFSHFKQRIVVYETWRFQYDCEIKRQCVEQKRHNEVRPQKCYLEMSGLFRRDVLKCLVLPRIPYLPKHLLTCFCSGIIASQDNVNNI